MFVWRSVRDLTGPTPAFDFKLFVHGAGGRGRSPPPPSADRRMHRLRKSGGGRMRRGPGVRVCETLGTACSPGSACSRRLLEPASRGLPSELGAGDEGER